MNGEEMKRLEQLFFQFKEEIKEDFRHQLGIQAESFQHKLDLVVEGHQMLSDKMNQMELRLNGRIDCVVQKLDAVAAQGNETAAKLDRVAAQGIETAAKLDAIAADLAAHRADTEAHRPVFRVKEPEK